MNSVTNASPHSTQELRAAFLILVFSLITLTLSVGQASAQGADPTLEVEPPQGPAGETVTLVGENYTGGFEATILWDDAEQTTFEIPDDGSFEEPFTIPANASSGSHLIEVCSNCDTEFEETATFQFQVIEPTDEPTATQPAPTETPTPTPTATSCPLDASYVADVTIPDGTEIEAGASFTKIWRLVNDGCQQWRDGTQLTFTRGNHMGGPDSIPAPAVQADQTTDLSVNLIAPEDPGDYRGYWQLTTPQGERFGPEIYVAITVPADAPAATSVSPAPTATPTDSLPEGAEPLAGDFPAADPAEFGFDTHRLNGQPLRGERPLLTILIDFSDVSFASNHTPDYYRQLMFEGTPGGLPVNIAGDGSFFAENSFGLFRFSNAGVLGPYTHRDKWYTFRADESTRSCASGAISPCDRRGYSFRSVRAEAIRLADINGFDFASYDENDDGVVTTDELTIQVIDATPSDVVGDGASTRWTDPRSIGVSGDVDVRGRVSGVGEAVSSASIAHELVHTQGVFWDIYGLNARMNYLFTTMGATMYGETDFHQITHLDGFHKMKFGWLKPEVIPLTAVQDSAICRTLGALEFDYGRSTPSEQALLLYDPARGTDEFFMVTYRIPYELNYDGDPWFVLSDGKTGLPDDPGIAIWYVKLNEDNTVPMSVLALNGGDGSDRAVFIMPPTGSPGVPVGYDGLWRPTDGDADLSWVLDDSDSGFTVAAEEISTGDAEAVVRIGEGPCPVEVPPLTIELPAVDLPEPPPCTPDEDTGIVSCTDELDGLNVERTLPWPVNPGDLITMRWTLTPTEELTGPIVIHDYLPPGMTPADSGDTPPAGREPDAPDRTSDEAPPGAREAEEVDPLSHTTVIEEPPAPGESVTVEYAVEAGDTQGRFTIPSDVSYGSGTETSAAQTETLLTIWSEEVPASSDDPVEYDEIDDRRGRIPPWLLPAVIGALGAVVILGGGALLLKAVRS